MKNSPNAILCGLLFLCAAPAFGQEILSAWDFIGHTGNEGNVGATTGHPLFGQAQGERGPGLTTLVVPNGYSSSDYTGSSVLDANDYVEVGLMPGVGTIYSVASFNFNYDAMGSSPTWELRSDLDGYTTALGVGFGAGGSESIDLSGVGALQNLAAPVRFRIYGYDSSLGNLGFIGSGNDIAIMGTAVPEPANLALISGLGLAAFALWRRNFAAKRAKLG